MKKIIILSFLFFRIFLSAGLASDLFPHLLEKDEVVFIDKKTKEKRSELTYTLKKSDSQYYFSRLGKGDCDKYKDITWETTAQIKEKEGFLYVLNTSCLAKDSKGNIIVQFEKEFDYDKKIIEWRQLDSQGKIRKSARFPIKGKTTDDITLIYFLRTYIANRDSPGYQSYYFLSNEPKLYKVNIRNMGHETIELPSGNKDALKFKLTGDMGIIDDILDRFVPHTYVWYKDTPPYEWLKYEGLETSMQSANVIAFIKKRYRE